MYKKSWVQKILGQKNWGVQKMLGQENLITQKIGPKNFQGQTNFETKTIMGARKSWYKKW